MMNSLTLLMIFFSFQTLALETDNYYAWEKELEDSSPAINRFFTKGIRNALRKIPNHSTKSCVDMTMLIAKDFDSKLVHDNPVENWLFEVLSDEEIFPASLKYVDKSIYRDPYRFYIPWFGLAPSIQVNGYYFGTDKLSHFASTGMSYFKAFRKALLQGNSVKSAERKAIDSGVLAEKKILGFWSSGVFSYGDLESNYQGLNFYRRFCESNSPYLKRDTGGNWHLAHIPNIQDYVNGFWDETFEESHRLPENWEKVALVLKDEYCSKKDIASVRARMGYYLQTSQKSYSKLYLEHLKDSGSIPDPQSFDQLCSKR